ncbi:hypothetical protein [Lewinella cohaerens]|uniref:hypothetical protein n=1 Tax=Lewinella cohaerens TaxID=70995 RepID=UPI00035FA42F|nr:hypothetical protein [Lewinella cohaerens]
MSNNINDQEVWIVGAGPMAVDHAKVLLHLGIKPQVIGRGEQSAQYFEKETKLSVIRGGIDTFLLDTKPQNNTFIIIAVGTEALMPMLLKFKNLSFNRILIEKPAAISINELLAHKQDLEYIQDKVFVAYNRRFYPSVQKAIELIKEDGGLQSMHFEFTEWSHKIAPLQKAPGVKENWFFANSTHVVDLAFFIAGQPKDWRAFSKKGTLDWHDKSFFSGAGITDKGVVFSYHSNWESAGRWGVELMTEKRKILLKPLEEVQIIKRGTISTSQINDDSINTHGLKPGLLEQGKAFIDTAIEDRRLISLNLHLKIVNTVYNPITA